MINSTGPLICTISTKTAASPERYLNSSCVLCCVGNSDDWWWYSYFFSSLWSVQEMTDIMHSIYDMMGKYTHPSMKDNAPKEHVDNFFQVEHTNQVKSRNLFKWFTHIWFPFVKFALKWAYQYSKCSVMFYGPPELLKHFISVPHNLLIHHAYLTRWQDIGSGLHSL